MCFKLKLPREISCANQFSIPITHIDTQRKQWVHSPGIGTFPRVVESLFLGHGKGFIHLKNIKRLQNYLYIIYTPKLALNYSRKS